jgi:hypothetical protein
METKVRTIRIDDWTWNETQKTATKIGTTASTLIRNAIIEKIQKIESGFVYDNDRNVESQTVRSSIDIRN